MPTWEPKLEDFLLKDPEDLAYDATVWDVAAFNWLLECEWKHREPEDNDAAEALQERVIERREWASEAAQQRHEEYESARFDDWRDE